MKAGEVDTVRLLTGGRLVNAYGDKGRAEIFIYFKHEGRSGALYWCVFVVVWCCDLRCAVIGVVSVRSQYLSRCVFVCSCVCLTTIRSFCFADCFLSHAHARTGAILWPLSSPRRVVSPLATSRSSFCFCFCEFFLVLVLICGWLVGCSVMFMLASKPKCSRALLVGLERNIRL